MITHNQKFYRSHTEKRKISSREYYRNLRKAAIEALGGKCVFCGFNDPRALQIDHINGGGKEDRKSIGNNKAFYRLVIKTFLNTEENKYQLLCANCNWIKRHEKQEVRQK